MKRLSLIAVMMLAACGSSEQTDTRQQAAASEGRIGLPQPDPIPTPEMCTRGSDCKDGTVCVQWSSFTTGGGWCEQAHDAYKPCGPHGTFCPPSTYCMKLLPEDTEPMCYLLATEPGSFCGCGEAMNWATACAEGLKCVGAIDTEFLIGTGTCQP